MKMTLHRLQLPLQHEFTISRGSINFQNSLVVELEEDGDEDAEETFGTDAASAS